MNRILNIVTYSSPPRNLWHGAHRLIKYMFEVSCTSSPWISGDLLASLFLLFWILEQKSLLLLPFMGHFTWTNIIICYIHTHIYFSLSSSANHSFRGRGCAYYVKKNKSSMEFAVLMVVRMEDYLAEYMTTHCQVEVSATNWSLLRRSPTDCGASLFVI